jgi:hypothetical protein
MHTRNREGDAVNEPDDIQMMPTNHIKMEDEAQEMMESPDLRPYLQNIEAVVTGRGKDKATKALSELPLEKRYLWRIASSLQTAFCDFDKSSVRADLNTMNADDFDTVVRLTDRGVQFCMLMRTIFGADAMEATMLEAISIAKRC